MKLTHHAVHRCVGVHSCGCACHKCIGLQCQLTYPFPSLVDWFWTVNISVFMLSASEMNFIAFMPSMYICVCVPLVTLCIVCFIIASKTLYVFCICHSHHNELMYTHPAPPTPSMRVKLDKCLIYQLFTASHVVRNVWPVLCMTASLQRYKRR